MSSALVSLQNSQISTKHIANMKKNIMLKRRAFQRHASVEISKNLPQQANEIDIKDEWEGGWGNEPTDNLAKT